MATERIVIEVTENGSRSVRRNLEDIGTGATNAKRGVDLLQSALAGVAGFLAVDQLVKTSDAYTTITNRIRQYTNSVEELNDVYARLFQISQETRTDFEQNSQLYQRLALTLRNLGQSQKDVLDLLKEINQAMVISSPATSEAKGGLIQFTQALAEGRLHGQELRSVLQELPKIADLIAKGMGKSREQLRQLGQDGALTPRVVIDALKKGIEETNAEFALVNPTIKSGLETLKTAAISFIGRAGEAAGASGVLAKAIVELAKNFDILALAIIGVVSIGGLALLVSTLSTLGSAVMGIVSILGGLWGALVAVAEVAVAVSAALILNPFALALLVTVAGLVYLTRDAFGELFKTLGGFSGIINTVLGWFVGLAAGILATWKHMPAAFADIGIQMANSLVGSFGRGVQMINDWAKKFGVRDFGVAKSLDNVFDNPYAGTANKVANAFKMGFEQAKTIDYTKELGDLWGSMMKQLEKIANPQTVGDLAKMMIRGGSDNKAAAPWTKQMESQLEALIKRLNPTISAMFEFKKDLLILNSAQAAGAISAQQYATLMENLKTKYQDVLDPLGKVNRELERQAGYLRMTAREAEVAQEMDKLRDDLKQKGQPFDAAAQARAKNQLEENQRLRDQQEVLKSIKGPMEDYKNNLAALDQLQKDNKVSLTEYQNAARQLRITYLDTQKDFASGFERSFLKLEDSVANVAKTSEELLTTAFDKAGDAVADFALTGKLSIDSFFQDLARQLIKMGTNQLLVGAGNSLGFGSGVSGGGSILGGIGNWLAKGVGSWFGKGGGGGIDAEIANWSSYGAGGASAAGAAASAAACSAASGAGWVAWWASPRAAPSRSAARTPAAWATASTTGLLPSERGRARS
jgi:lambda family phage tail tape measure protein